MRRGLVFNTVILAVLLFGSAALAVTTTVNGSAPDPVRAVVTGLTGWMGIDLPSHTPDRAGPPEHAGPKPADFVPGSQSDPGPPDGVGPPAHSNAPDGAGQPQNAGSQAGRGKGQSRSDSKRPNAPGG